ncbi:NAD(+) synthase [Alkalilimnicola ehrlichii]|uniref:Glutamine-dependent NAD(+) synthetase n=1 Tax=Alkalilimnicola ehrlichii TaxID=351052 RepID=A0A3E0WFW9_9GAMM|nr:NAD(+) synthase [Alkalilimnicola ehrlichii]RFA31844.1 NAD(+) synthase [Alkalilimnicola ehrlichii]
MSKKDFYSIYTHGFLRCAVCMPAVRVADPRFNAERTLELAQRASDAGAGVALFPELGLSAYSNDDLFHQDALLEACLEALQTLIDASADLAPLLLIGMPLRVDGRLFNVAITLYRGRILGVAPKTYLPNYREYYEKRQFTSGRDTVRDTIELLGQSAPFGNDLLYAADNWPDFILHTEICEDVWAPIPPSTYAAMAGATVLANLSASNITIGKAEDRRDLCAAQSGKCIAAYLYSAAGPGESTNDLAWDGHAVIFENGKRLAESERFPSSEQLILADIDLERLAQERMRTHTFTDTAGVHREQVRRLRRVGFTFSAPERVHELKRPLERFPYVPSDLEKRDEQCYEAYNIQVHGLAKRIQSSGIERLVIGVSGGLDSTHALIVAAKTMDRLGLPRTNIYAYTMPGFATSNTTLKNAHALMRDLGVTAAEIDIRPSCQQMLRDIGHPAAEGEPVYDVTFENVQAGERTSHLFRLANRHHAMVVGTGDLSELALGWATYGVGDHMSHYNVNVSVPKTLIQYLIRWVISSRQFDSATAETLQAVLDTEISPELVPGEDDSGEPAQSTEAKIGPYELQDFNIYYVTRYGFRPSKVAFLSWQAWHDRNRGAWPPDLAPEKRNQYDIDQIKHWLELFLYRFFKISQFKRTCIPNGPKVGSGGSLSPRGDWRAPSDSEAELWLRELRDNVPKTET